MRGASGQHGQFTVSGEILNRAMMLGNWLTNSSSATLGVKPSFGTKTRPPRSATNSSSGRLGSSGCFLLGNQHAIAVGEFHLHVGNASTGRRPRRVLNRKFGEPGQFPEASEVTLLR